MRYSKIALCTVIGLLCFAISYGSSGDQKESSEKKVEKNWVVLEVEKLLQSKDGLWVYIEIRDNDGKVKILKFPASMVKRIRITREEVEKNLAKKIENPYKIPPKPDFNPKLPRGLRKTPKIEDSKQVEKPIKDIAPEKVITEKPKRNPADDLSGKNLDWKKTIGAIGVGGGKAGAYGHRFGKGKLSKEGGSKASEGAVLAALLWLKRHQNPQGYWKSDTFDDGCRRFPKCKNKYPGPTKDAKNKDLQIGRGMDGYDTGVSALALLAFLGNGQSHKYGRFRKVVHKGIKWLKKIQVNDPSSQWHGSIGYMINGKKASQPEWVYNHAIATMALCEAYAITKDFTLKEYAQRAVDFCVKCQNPGFGWRYDDRSPEGAIKPGRNDTSLTGWMILALKSAKTGGLTVPKSAFEGGLDWIRRVTRSSGRVGYMTPGGSSSVLAGRQGLYDEVPSMNAVGVLCRIFCGQSRYSQDVRKGTKILMNSLPQWDPNNCKTANLYYWYYGTYAMFQIGGRDWQQWNQALQKALLTTQRQGVPGDCNDGSWDPVSEWGIAGGRVYSTALAALTLEVYYRYERKR